MARTINVKARIYNMDEDLPGKGYLVARQFITAEQGASLWYYGFFEEKKRAERAAVELGNGVVLEVEGEKPVKIAMKEDEV